MAGPALVIGRTHIYEAGVFARAGSIICYTTSPPLAIAGGGPVSILQCFVFDSGIGVGCEGPDFADFLCHVVALVHGVWISWFIYRAPALAG